MTRPELPDDLLVTWCLAHGESYVWIYRPSQIDEMLLVLERQGADPQLELTPAQAVRVGKSCVREAFQLEGISNQGFGDSGI